MSNRILATLVAIAALAALTAVELNRSASHAQGAGQRYMAVGVSTVGNGTSVAWVVDVQAQRIIACRETGSTNIGCAISSQLPQ